MIISIREVMVKVITKMIMFINNLVIARLNYLAVRGKMQQTKLLAQPCRGLIRPSPFQFVINDYKLTMKR